MGIYTEPKPVKLIIGLLSMNQELEKIAVDALIEQFGEVDCALAPFRFQQTNYYEDEIGSEPLKSFYSFKKLIQREETVEIKRITNDFELQLFDGKRKVNIDPGYMTLGQFFLATTKDQRQRVYIKDGIFIEPCLYFQKRKWHHFEWTYFDYRTELYKDYFLKCRTELNLNYKSAADINLGLGSENKKP